MTTPTTEPRRHLGRYELVHMLGQGGMGEVYLAKISGAAGFEKPCIVKTILPSLLKDSQFLDRFHHEAKVLVHLVHSSIAQVYDMGEAEGTYYMALEYVAGVDVAYLAEQARTQGQPIPVPVALYIGQKVAEGLGYAHRKAGPDGSPLGIVHRDVSPHNVMVSYEGEVKVIDFGLAKSAARSKYTMPSTVMGKLGYMSPEQARAEPLDHRSDIYSCAVMIWELLAGRPLIPQGTVGEMMAAMSRPHVPALHELRPEVSPAIDAVVRRALAAHPQERYGRSDELARALNEQLLRSSSSLGAEEVGNFVRALCPEAFSAQRKLISRISGVRRAPSTPPGSGVMHASDMSPASMGSEPMMGLEATSVRPLSQMEAEGGVTYRPMATPLPLRPGSGATPMLEGTFVPRAAQTGPLVAAPSVSSAQPAAAQSGAMAPASGITNAKLVVAGLILLVVMIGVAGTTAYFMRPPAGPPPPLAHREGGPPPDGDGRHPPPRPGEPGWRPGDRHPHPGDRPLPPGDRPLPPGDRPLPPEGGPRREPPPPAPNPGPAREAGTVAAAGSEGSATVAPAVGSEGSAAVVPAVEKGPEAKAPTSRPKPKPTAVFIVANDPVQIREREGRYGVPAGKRAGLTPGLELPVVGAALKDGKRKVLGSAVVEAVMPGKSVLTLDEAASKAGGDRFVVLPKDSAGEAADTEAEAAVVPPSPAPAPPAPAKDLRVGVRRNSFMGMGTDKGFSVNNSESRVLWNCKATMGSGLRYVFRQLRVGSNKVKQGQFVANTEAPTVPQGVMLIECDEGRVEAQIQPD